MLLDSHQSSEKKLDALAARILLAEDNEDNRDLISRHLTRGGYEVKTAANGRFALQMLESATAQGPPFDLLITDIQMPEMDGYTLTRTLRSLGNRIPIIALTANFASEDRRQCLEAGCNDFATKPVEKQVLIAACSKWIRTSRDAITPVISVSVPSAKSVTGCSGVLMSEFADNPDWTELVDKYLCNLNSKIDCVTELLTSRNLDELAKVAHQIKGAGGGYGFPSITQAAKGVVEEARSGADLEKIQNAVHELVNLCQMAIAGGKHSGGAVVKSIASEQE